MKKLLVILAVVVLAAAIILAVMVNQKNKAASELAAANDKAADLQAQLDEAAKQSQAAQIELEALKAQLSTAQTELENAAQLKDANVEGLQAQLDEAAKQYQAAQTELEASKAQLAAAQTELENITAQLNEAKAAGLELNAKFDAAAAEKDLAASGLDEALTAKAALEEQVNQLTADAEAKAQEAAASLDALNKEIETLKAEAQAAAVQAAADLETAKAEAQAKADELAAQIAALTADLEAALVRAPEYKFGLGMVTKIGSVAEATAEKAGAAQVNTTVCSLVLDAEGKIVSVIWDVQQTKIQFSLEGKPVDLPEELLTKLEKGPAYGMVKASAIGKEWFEQIAAFAEYAKGKTVDELLNIPVYVRDENHTAVPDVEELKASVTISVGDYLASLKKAAENAK